MRFMILMLLASCVHVKSYAEMERDCDPLVGDHWARFEAYNKCMDAAEAENREAAMARREESRSSQGGGYVAASILSGIGQGIQNSQAQQVNCTTNYSGNQAYTTCR